MPTKSRPADAQKVRKNIRLDQRKLTAVRRLLGARTETEALDRALELALFQERVTRGLDRLAAAGGLATVFPDETLTAARPAAGVSPARKER
jgi:hypothetical protein